MRVASVDTYWNDFCPVCEERCTQGCRCPDNHRSCENGHHWRRFAKNDQMVTVIETVKNLELVRLTGFGFLSDYETLKFNKQLFERRFRWVFDTEKEVAL